MHASGTFSNDPAERIIVSSERWFKMFEKEAIYLSLGTDLGEK